MADLHTHGSGMIQDVSSGADGAFVEFSHGVADSGPQIFFRSFRNDLCIDKDPFCRFFLERILP